MDQDRFDRLARRLGAGGTRRAALRAALGGLVGMGAGIAALDAAAERAGARRREHGRDPDDRADAARRRRKTCKPACTDGFVCAKVGKKRECQCPSGVECGGACCGGGQSCVAGQCRAAACDPPCANGHVCDGTQCACPSGVECGGACCAAGQACQDGACADRPRPEECIPAGEPCKNAGRPCCDGRTCASGQGGMDDIACYAPKTGACRSTADCVYGMQCQEGRCAPPPPAGLGAACDAAAQQLCTTPGAVCTPYTGPGAPAGAHCTLPLGAVCTGDPECTCYKCSYPNAAPGAAGRAARDASRFACCGYRGFTCRSDRNCCLGFSCVNGTCAGGGCVVMAADGPAGLQAALDSPPESGIITIEPGTYAGDFAVSGKTLLLTPCEIGTPGDVVIRNGTELTPCTGSTIEDFYACAPRSRALAVSGSADITLEHIVVGCSTCGASQGGGGGVSVADSALTLVGTTKIVGNTRVAGGADAWLTTAGGGVFLKNATLAMRAGTEVSGNAVTAATGAFGAGGGGIFANYESSVVLSGSATVKDNASANADGAGINVGPVNVDDGSAFFETGALGGALTMDGGSVVGNACTGTATGGGIRVNDGAALTMNATALVSGNQSAGNGGGVSVAYGSATMNTGARVEDNDAPTGVGGGLHVTAGSLTVQRGATISLNHARQGGGVNLAGGDAVITLNPGAEVTENSCQWGGAGLLINSAFSGERPILYATDALIADNVAGLRGGGIWVAGGRAAIGGATKITGNRASATGSTLSDGGGGIFVSAAGSVVTIGGTTEISGNRSRNGGGIGASTGAFNPSTPPVSITIADQVRIFGNHGVDGTTTNGDGIWMARQSSSIGPNFALTCTGSPVVCGNAGNAPTLAGNCFANTNAVNTGLVFTGCGCAGSPATCPA